MRRQRQHPAQRSGRGRSGHTGGGSWPRPHAGGLAGASAEPRRNGRYTGPAQRRRSRPQPLSRHPDPERRLRPNQDRRRYRGGAGRPRLLRRAVPSEATSTTRRWMEGRSRLMPSAPWARLHTINQTGRLDPSGAPPGHETGSSRCLKCPPRLPPGMASLPQSRPRGHALHSLDSMRDRIGDANNSRRQLDRDSRECYTRSTARDANSLRVQAFFGFSGKSLPLRHAPQAADHAKVLACLGEPAIDSEPPIAQLAPSCDVSCSERSGWSHASWRDRG